MRLWWATLLLVTADTAFAQPATSDHDEPKPTGDEPPVQDIAPDDPAPPTPTTPPAPTAAVAPAPTPAEQVHTMDELTIPTSFLRFGINFFGDTSFTVTAPEDPGTAFTIGTLGLRLLGQLSRSLDAGNAPVSKDPEKMTQKEYEMWRKSQGARPFYRGNKIWLLRPCSRLRSLLKRR